MSDSQERIVQPAPQVVWQKIRSIDGKYPSPIDINVINTTKLTLPLIVWNNYSSLPKKMKLTNTGETVILSAKWTNERPFLSGGCLEGNYVFSQIHFHWGSTATNGSEHTIDQTRMPLEMHVMHFKRDYLNQSDALKHEDGVICVTYIFQIRSQHSSKMHPIVSSLKHIRMANTSMAITPFVLTDLVYPFEYDYFMYWGSVCNYVILWLISREIICVSFEQLRLFYQIMDERLVPIRRNWREINCAHKRTLFHVNPATQYTNITLSPVPLRLKKSREILSKVSDDMKQVNLIRMSMYNTKWSSSSPIKKKK